MDLFGQSPFACRLQWGLEGARQAAAAGHIIIIVDVLVFSTSIATVVAQGASVLPVDTHEAVADAVARFGAREIPSRRYPSPEGWSHSPPSLLGLPTGLRGVYHSVNGATCCAAAARGGAAVLVGALANARTVGRAAARLHRSSGRPVTVVACGELWENGSLRPALEDHLGAGAIIAASGLDASAEAQAAAALFQARQDRLAQDLWDCGSGRELVARGYGKDVTFAAQLDRFDTVPWLNSEGWLQNGPPIE